MKVPRSTAPESSDLEQQQQPAEVEVNGHDKIKIPMPSQEMDEMDAAEAAQFKADVQGHRQQEVLTYPTQTTLRSEFSHQRCSSIAISYPL